MAPMFIWLPDPQKELNRFTNFPKQAQAKKKITLRLSRSMRLPA